MDQPISNQHANSASRLTVTDEGIISVEHPCVVKNVEKAIDMIGGPTAISQVVQEGSDQTFALTFRPQDPSPKTIIANRKVANNILLKISVPRRTGRKRKRGSDDSWTEDLTASAPNKDAKYLVDSMADNASSYKVTALSTIPSMHMWRSMPDFVYSTSHIKILQDAKDTLLSQHYPTIKTFDLPYTYGIEDTTTLPPPIWSNQNIPNSYTYRQNPSVRVSHDPITGRDVIGNTQAPPKTYTYQIAWDDVEYPTTPMSEITPFEKQSPLIQETVIALQALFHQRPIWSRRALLNCLPSNLSAFNVVRFCLGYVSYAIRSGPWRDSLVLLGIDPRKDPKYRVYQTIMLQLMPRSNQLAFATGVGPRKTSSYKPRRQTTPKAGGETPDIPTPTQAEKKRLLASRKTFQRKWTGPSSINSHIFDGHSPLPPDGKVWQLCDLTDPQLAALRDVPDLHIRATCESRYFGWYENGTNAKIRVALKAKVEALAEGNLLDPALLEGFLKLPEKLGFEVDAESARNTAVSYSQQAENPIGDTQGSPKPSEESSSNNVSAYLGDNPSQQQLSWAAAYRVFAKTGLGAVPASGASGQGRLTKSKPVTRKSYLGKKTNEVVTSKEVTSQNLDTTAVQNKPVNRNDKNVAINVTGTTQNVPIDVDIGAQMNDAEMDNEDEIMDGPNVEEGEEILPSIEFNGFDMGDDNDSELGLDDEEPEIKIEED